MREADRLGLEMSLNIQSGWNLGGPMVTADDAAKKLVWSEARVRGPGQSSTQAAGAEEPRQLLPRPVRRGVSHQAGRADPSRPGCPESRASSEQAGHRGERGGRRRRRDVLGLGRRTEPGEGPTASKPEWLQLNFEAADRASDRLVASRAGRVTVRGSANCRSPTTAKSFGAVKAFSGPKDGRAAGGRFRP